MWKRGGELPALALAQIRDRVGYKPKPFNQRRRSVIAEISTAKPSTVSEDAVSAGDLPETMSPVNEESDEDGGTSYGEDNSNNSDSERSGAEDESEDPALDSNDNDNDDPHRDSNADRKESTELSKEFQRLHLANREREFTVQNSLLSQLQSEKNTADTGRKRRSKDPKQRRTSAQRRQSRCHSVQVENEQSANSSDVDALGYATMLYGSSDEDSEPHRRRHVRVKTRDAATDPNADLSGEEDDKDDKSFLDGKGIMTQAERDAAFQKLLTQYLGLLQCSPAEVARRLHTKIRLIEVAEQYKYDPKCASRSKQEGAAIAAQNGKEQMSGIRLAAQFGLNKSTVSRILKRKEEFKKAYYKDNISGCSKHINKKSKYEKLNRLVESWFDMSREKNVAVSDTHLREVGKRFAEDLGVEDFRGSNGWVRSLRNRKEHTTRNLSLEAQEIEKIKKDAEAIERIRQIFPNGVKDMAGFFKDLSTYLEKEGGGMAGFGDMSGDSSSSGSGSGSGRDATASYTDMEDDIPRDEEAVMAEEFLKKKMIESLRTWSEELVEAEVSKFKKRGKPRQAAML
ncbi:hypothetical protein BBJ29_008965 [Phytophthora kernoviae]|uniref:HTH CENPB-type domain-containing protein n=1 Tax=Phytophthora kernoviae TaxID=325452 RepID=A0A3F2RCU5_9STRA|nr:hypothetical protein BBP00_00009369 [Phytophthora kernoviae]RLN71852.1 hypothetical protein BBJ29_008965 [Phytophthora kernoviae]